MGNKTMKNTIQTRSRKDTILCNASIIVCLVAMIFLLIELFLTKSGKTLCPTSACEIVARYTRFGEPLLLAIGAGFFLVLAASLFFAKRYPANLWLPTLPILLLIGAASFDGSLIGFQLTTIGQKCVICLGVASTLAVLAILYGASLKRWGITFLCITAWLSGYAATASIIMPDVTTASAGMVFYERPAAKDIKQAPTATFVFSTECPHCADVLEYLAKKNPTDMKWRFAITDSSKKSINKLGWFYDKAAQDNNPFQLLLESKEKEGRLHSTILAKFPDYTRQTRVFLSNNGINGVPLLVVDEGNTTIFYKGSTAILEYLKQKY